MMVTGAPAGPFVIAGSTVMRIGAAAPALVMARIETKTMV